MRFMVVMGRQVESTWTRVNDINNWTIEFHRNPEPDIAGRFTAVSWHLTGNCYYYEKCYRPPGAPLFWFVGPCCIISPAIWKSARFSIIATIIVEHNFPPLITWLTIGKKNDEMLRFQSLLEKQNTLLFFPSSYVTDCYNKFALCSHE